jgi:hypothetical protein
MSVFEFEYNGAMLSIECYMETPRMNPEVPYPMAIIEDVEFIDSEEIEFTDRDWDKIQRMCFKLLTDGKLTQRETG